MLVGGSALYTRAILDRFEFPGTDESLRRELEGELERVGTAALHQRLAGLDPEAAAQIVPDNGRRIVRALEVIALTGRPYSASLPTPTYADPHSVQIGVDIDRPTLDARIEQAGATRCSTPGLSRRSSALLESGSTEGQTARRAIGYREAIGLPRAASSPATRRSSRRRPRRGGSPGGRTAGSARTRASSGCGFDDEDRVEQGRSPRSTPCRQIGHPQTRVEGTAHLGR